MAIDINAAKAALCECTCKSQVMYVVECAADNDGYNYRFDKPVDDNAVYADVDGHHDLAKVLRFADKQLARMK